MTKDASVTCVSPYRHAALYYRDFCTRTQINHLFRAIVSNRQVKEKMTGLFIYLDIISITIGIF